MESPPADAILADEPRSQEGAVSEDLVRRAQRGDHAAFEVLAAAAIDRLYAIARRVLRDDAAAEDAVQDCLVRAWRDVRSLRDASRWEAWLYRLLRNACRDEQRRSRRRPVVVEIDPLTIASGFDELGDITRRDELERGFRRLSVDHRIVLAMHFYLGLRAGEIAGLLGIPEGTATSRIHYASRALRAALDGAPPVAARSAGAIE
jgi:RNA polymerase sigma-70 factor (ECF subfamily)